MAAAGVEQVLLPDLGPIPLRERNSILFVERCFVDVQDGAFVMIDKDEVRTHVPLGGTACLLLEPGVRLSHRAAALAARVGALLVWVGEGGVRLYSAGQPGGARADKLLHQARMALDEQLRLQVVRNMYRMRFGEEPPQRRSVEQLRGIEGARVRRSYQLLAQKFGVKWRRREYDQQQWDSGDMPNRCLSAATACLYGVSEAAVLAAGYSPAIGFIHTGKPLSFVYDIADIVKFETVVPAAFRIAAQNPENPERMVRHECRDIFRRSKLLDRIIPLINEVLTLPGESPPTPPADALPPAIANKQGLADDGHRN